MSSSHDNGVPLPGYITGMHLPLFYLPRRYRKTVGGCAKAAHCAFRSTHHRNNRICPAEKIEGMHPQPSAATPRHVIPYCNESHL